MQKRRGIKTKELSAHNLKKIYRNVQTGFVSAVTKLLGLAQYSRAQEEAQVVMR